MPLWNQFLIKTYDYSPQPSTLLNFTTGVFIRLFWNSGTENFGNYLEKRMQYSIQQKKNVSLLRTAYYRTKKYMTKLFRKCSERKGCSKTLNIPKRTFAKLSLTLLRLCECSEIVGNLPGKGLYWNCLLMLQGRYLQSNTLLEITSYNFQGMCAKTASLQVSENS